MIANILDRLEAVEKRLSEIENCDLPEINFADNRGRVKRRIAFVRRLVRRAHGITPRLFTRHVREEQIAWPRQKAMYLCRRIPGATVELIGEIFHRDHGTVIHAERVVEGRMEIDQRVRVEIEDWIKRLELDGAPRKFNQKERL